MSVISTGQQPFNDKAHGHGLMLKICEGLRPAFSNNTPKFYIGLAYKCMNADPDKRPTAKEIHKIISFWYDSLNNYLEARLIRNGFEKMDKVKFYPSTITETVHLNAIYTSRLLKLTNLPLPVNSRKVMIIGNNNSNYFCLIIE